MRVCLISVEFFINKSGGFGRATRTIGRELVKRGIEVFAIVPQQGDQELVEEHDGVTVLAFPKSSPWTAYRLSKEVNADVYHSCEPSMTTVFAMRAMPQKKHIITFRDPRNWDDWRKEYERPARSKLQVISNWMFEANPIVRSAVRRSDGVYSIGQYLVPKIKSIYGVESEFLPTPVDVESPDAPGKLPKSDTPTVGWLARWDPVKRPEIFLEMVSRFPDVRFRFAGSAVDKEWEAGLKSKYGSAPNLEWIGRIDQFRDPKSHSDFLDDAWIMVNASTKEAMPNAVLEAAAHRCAILSGLDPDGFASKFGYYATRESGSSGYPSVDDFSRGLAWLLEDNRWRSQGMAGYEHVRQTFETETAIGRHINIYKNLLSG